MPRFAPQNHLLKVSTAKNRDFKQWQLCKHLESSSGRSIDELRLRAAADRWHLARICLLQAKRMLTSEPPFFRAGLSRAYYSMYHAMRAVAFIYHKGDDHQEHKTLPGKTPQDFPNSALWQNELKNAREQRNRADYDPYPKSDKAWKRDAESLVNKALQLVNLSKHYIQNKGCNHL